MVQPPAVGEIFHCCVAASPWRATPRASSSWEGGPKVSRQSAWPVKPARNGPTGGPPYCAPNAVNGGASGSAVSHGASHSALHVGLPASTRRSTARWPPPASTTASITPLRSTKASRCFQRTNWDAMVRATCLHRSERRFRSHNLRPLRPGRARLARFLRQCQDGPAAGAR